MVRLLRDVMGLRVEFEQPTTTELSLPSGDRVQVFAPGDPYFDFSGKHASGPVAGAGRQPLRARQPTMERAVTIAANHDQVVELQPGRPSRCPLRTAST
jgi:hypothetical protein